MNVFKDLGLGRNLEKPGLFSKVPTEIRSNFEDGIAQATIQSGEATYKASLVTGYLQSSNFTSGSIGWQINADGVVEFDSGYFRGDISASTGTFGNLVINGEDAPNAILINDDINDRIILGYYLNLW